MINTAIDDDSRVVLSLPVNILTAEAVVRLDARQTSQLIIQLTRHLAVLAADAE